MRGDVESATRSGDVCRNCVNLVRGEGTTLSVARHVEGCNGESKIRQNGSDAPPAACATSDAVEQYDVAQVAAPTQKADIAIIDNDLAARRRHTRVATYHNK